MAAGRAGTPKYIHILDTLRQRIVDGIYQPGSALPSENQIATEFGASRATVLKSLQALKQDSWVESKQGKANFVRGRPAVRRSAPAHALVALGEAPGVEALTVAPVLADTRVAGLLAVPEGTPVYRREHRTVGRAALVTVFVSLDVAAGSELTAAAPVADGLLAHLTSRKIKRGDYAVEQATARRPTLEEADLLSIDKEDPVLAITVTAYTATGDPVLTSTLVMPGECAETETTYPLT